MAAKRGKRVFIGVSGGFDRIYMGVSVCATRVRGALRVVRGVWCVARGAWCVVCGVACHGMRQRITRHWQ